MHTRGLHLLAEYHGCAGPLLDDPQALEALLREAAAAARATVVGARLHRFAPQGVSGVLLIAESHLALHTWPEAGYVAVDFYTCGGLDPWPAHDALARGLGAARAETLLVERGLAGPMQVGRGRGAGAGDRA